MSSLFRARRRIEANRAAARALREENARKDEERRRQREETLAKLARQAEKVEAAMKAAGGRPAPPIPANHPPPKAQPMRAPSVFGDLIAQLLQVRVVSLSAIFFFFFFCWRQPTRAARTLR